MDSFYGAASDRLVNAASAYEMNDPRTAAIIDGVTKAIGITPVSQMGSSSQAEIKAIVTMVLDQMGMTPGKSDFLNMHRAVMQAGASGYSISGVKELGGGYVGTSAPGVGNISTAVASQIASGVTTQLSTLKGSTGTAREGFDSGAVNGLNQTTSLQIASQYMAKRGFKEGDIRMIDFGEDSGIMTGTGSKRHATGDEMKKKLDEMTGRGGTFEGMKDSAEFKEMYRHADILRQRDKYIQDHGEIFGGQLDLSNEKHREALDEFYKNGLTDPTDRKKKMTLTDADRMGIESLDRGEGKSFMVAKDVRAEVAKAVKNSSENIAELSKIFGTDDLNQLQMLAENMGMASLTEQSKVKSVKDAIFRAKKIAVMTGRSVKEVMEEQQGIVSTAAMGGSPIGNTAAAAIQEHATASESKNSWKTKEQREGEAVRSSEAAKSYMMNLMVLEALAKEGGLTGKDKEEAEALLEQAQKGGYDKEELDRKLSRAGQLIDRSSMAEVAKTDAFKQHAVETTSLDYTSRNLETAQKYNYGKALKRTFGSHWDANSGTFAGDAYMQQLLEQSGSKDAAMETALNNAETMRKAFGTGNDAARDELFSIYSSTADSGERSKKLEEYIAKKKKEGATDDEVERLRNAGATLSSLSVDAVKDYAGALTAFGKNDATASQDTTGITYQMKKRRAETKLAVEGLDTDVMYHKDGGLTDFGKGINGKVNSGQKLTGDEALVSMLGRAGLFNEDGSKKDKVETNVYELDEYGNPIVDEDGNRKVKTVNTYIGGQMNLDKLASEGLDNENSSAWLGAAKESYLAKNKLDEATMTDEQKAKMQEELGKIQEELSGTRGMADLVQLGEKYGITMKKHKSGNMTFTSDSSKEMIRTEENDRNRRLGMMGWETGADIIFGEGEGATKMPKEALTVDKYARNANGEYIKDAEGKLIENDHAGEDITTTLVGSRKIFRNAKGQLTDSNGNVQGDKGFDASALEDADAAFKEMWEGGTFDKGDNGAAAIKALRDAGQDAMADDLERGRALKAQELASTIKPNMSSDQVKKADEMAQKGDINGLLNLKVEAAGGAEEKSADGQVRRNQTLAMIMKAHDAAAQGSTNVMNNEYLAYLKKEGLVEFSGDDKKGWIATEKAQQQFGDLFKKGDKLFGSAGDLRNKLGTSTADNFAKSMSAEMEEKLKEKAREEQARVTQEYIGNIAHNLYLLTKEEAGSAVHPGA